MADASMVRNLAAQAEAIWPQERPLLERHAPAEPAAILDLACGTGEITVRLAELFPRATVVGVDLLEPHLERARARCRGLGERVRFERGDAFGLSFPERSFDLVVCRHLLQAVPEPERVVSEMVRVARPGGVLHVVAEDYAMMHFHPTAHDTDRFWLDGPIAYARSTGCDLRSGRRIYGMFGGHGLIDVWVDYVVVDTLRVPRPVFARIWRAWQDGYARVIAEHTAIPLEEVSANFDEMIAAIEDPAGYAVWHLPVISGRLP
jgi:ubiquinone/menaquinone biosynthesis C-methylase UbiE